MRRLLFPKTKRCDMESGQNVRFVLVSCRKEKQGIKEKANADETGWKYNTAKEIDGKESTGWPW